MTQNHPPIEFKDNIVEERQLIISDYKDIFLRNDTGARLLKDLENFCGIKRNPYQVGCFDGTAYNCGKLEVIKYIHRMLEAQDAPLQAETENERK